MIEFYNVKKKTKVLIDSARVSKKTYEKLTKAGKLWIRYCLKAIDEDGTKLSKFCAKADFDSIVE